MNSVALLVNYQNWTALIPKEVDLFPPWCLRSQLGVQHTPSIIWWSPLYPSFQPSLYEQRLINFQRNYFALPVLARIIGTVWFLSDFLECCFLPPGWEVITTIPEILKKFLLLKLKKKNWVALGTLPNLQLVSEIRVLSRNVTLNLVVC